MRTGQILMLVGVVSMVVGAFGMGATLRRELPREDPTPLGQQQALDAGAFDTLAQPLPREVTVGGADAGTKAKEFDPTERRADFKAQMDLMAMDIGIKYGDNVSASQIFFAVTNTAKNDAAFVLFKAEKMKQTTGVLFIFNGTGWKTFPSDFQ